MIIDTLSTSSRGSRSPQKALELAKVYLENARKATNPEFVTTFCDEAKAALSRMEQPSMETLLSSNSSHDQSLREDINHILNELDEMMASLKQLDSTQAVHKDTDNLRHSITPTNTESTTSQSTDQVDSNTEPTTSQSTDQVDSNTGSTTSQSTDQVGANTGSTTSQSTNQADPGVVPRHIFAVNRRPPAMTFKLPGCGESITDIPQLAYCLGLLQAWRSSPDAVQDPTARNWLHLIDKDKDEINRIMALATDVVTTFTREGIKVIEFLEEAVRLAPVLDKPVYRYLLGQLCDHIERSTVLDCRLLECLAQVIQGASTEHLDPADVIKIIQLIVRRLSHIHQEPLNRIYDLTWAVSRVVDAIAGSNVKSLDHQGLLQSLSVYLDGLMATSDPRQVYQAAYTYQALQNIPVSQPSLNAVLQGMEISTWLMNNAKAMDVKEVLQGLQDIHNGTEHESKKGSQGNNVESLLDYLKDGRNIACKQTWYPALRIADALLQGGHFTEFKKLVYEAPCRRNPAFQWGLCHLLGDLSASFEWDTNTRLNAVAFLEDVYRNDDVWGQQTDTKVLNGLGVEFKLYQSRKQHIMDQQDEVYVEPRAKDSLQRFRLIDNIKEFLRGNRKVFLLSGSAGSGKSTFSCALERDLWNKYKKMKGPIPIYVNMSAPDQSYNNMIDGGLRKLGFMDDQIQELKAYRNFILICDEYDPTSQPENLYASNTLNQPGGWHAKMIICCRTEHLGSTLLDCLYPTDQDSQVQPELFQQAVIEPFNVDQVQDYIKQYVSLQHPNCEKDDYLRVFEKIDDNLRVFEQDNCLHDLSRNPLLLSLTMDVLPRLVDSQHTLSSKKFNKVDIYDQIVALCFERSKSRLNESDLEGKDTERFACGDIVQSGFDYLKKLAAAIYKNQDGIPVVEYSRLYSRFKCEEAWKEDFFGQEGLSQVLRESSPLKRCGNKFHFIHPSFLEYGLALAVHDPQEFKRVTTSKPALTRRGSMDSVMSFESNDTDVDATTTVDNGHEQESPLIWRTFVNDHSILEFLEDRARQDPLCKQKLMAFIELSKTEKKWRTAAANSITILVGAGVSFRGADLQGIQVPGANLSQGSFESAQLQGADLRKTTLLNTGLFKADLTQAQMKGVQFGEYPFIPSDEAVGCCAYSPDGKHVAVGLNNGRVSVYSTSSWERIRTLEGHSLPINSVAFSTRGALASGSADKTVRVWDTETEKCLKTLTGHTGDVFTVAFSPQGYQVASGSDDQSIRVWDVSSGICQRTLSGHAGAVYSVLFLPNCRQLASGSGDKTVRIWDLETGTLHSTLSGHDDAVYSIAYSPQGHLIASGSGDNTVRLWSEGSGTCQTVLRGHLGAVRSVAFSPQHSLVSSGGTDNSIRLWDVKTGSCRDILSDHDKAVRTVVFSPKGDHFVSGSEDKTVRLWNVGARLCRHKSKGRIESTKNATTSPARNLVATPNGKVVQLWDLDTGECIRTLTGHSDTIWAVALSPAGNRAASGGNDWMVRLWDAETGACLHVLSDHGDCVMSVAFSSGGNQIASSSVDKTIRVWDAETGQCTQILSGHSNWVYSIEFSPTDDQIVSGSADMTVRLWDVKAKSCIHILEGHNGFVYRVAFSPRGDAIASGDADGTVWVWDVKTGTCRRVLSAHSSWVRRMAFSPSGDQLASSSYTGSVRLYSVDSSASLDRSLGVSNILAWRTKSGQDCLVAGKMEPDQKYLFWIPAHRLDLTDATLLDVRGLSDLDKRLLVQRGAVNVPALNVAALD
ncbi:hypothetical protein BGX31_010462 [Mortierella sp. GBA43]|nr:hypothetical protein BGX31_010462 [Mortierella sp. GBA43]